MDGAPDGGSDKTNEFTYDGSGHTLTLKAYLTRANASNFRQLRGAHQGGREKIRV